MNKIFTGTGEDGVIHQHRKPICNNVGACIGYSGWKNGEGLPWWPHRVLRIVDVVK